MARGEIKELLSSLAEEIKSAARSSKEEIRRGWPSSSTSDREMRRMASRDEKEMRHIAALVKAGKIKEAYTRADCMDTVVRETMPSHFWEFAEAASRLEKTLGRSSANNFSVSLK